MKRRKSGFALLVMLILMTVPACNSTKEPGTSESPLSPIATSSPLPSPTATSEPGDGLAIESAVRLGEPFVAEDGFEIIVLDVQRDAADILLQMNPFNIIGDDEEIILVYAGITLAKDPDNPIVLHPIDFDIADQNGNIYPYPLYSIVKEELAAKFSQAASIEGYLAFSVPLGLKDLYLQYYPKNRGETYAPRWFMLQ